jgi:hypothetical protein
MRKKKEKKLYKIKVNNTESFILDKVLNLVEKRMKQEKAIRKDGHG